MYLKSKMPKSSPSQKSDWVQRRVKNLHLCKSGKKNHFFQAMPVFKEKLTSTPLGKNTAMLAKDGKFDNLVTYCENGTNQIIV